MWRLSALSSSCLEPTVVSPSLIRVYSARCHLDSGGAASVLPTAPVPASQWRLFVCFRGGFWPFDGAPLACVMGVTGQLKPNGLVAIFQRTRDTNQLNFEPAAGPFPSMWHLLLSCIMLRKN